MILGLGIISGSGSFQGPYRSRHPRLMWWGCYDVVFFPAYAPRLWGHLALGVCVFQVRYYDLGEFFLITHALAVFPAHISSRLSLNAWSHARVMLARLIWSAWWNWFYSKCTKQWQTINWIYNLCLFLKKRNERGEGGERRNYCLF